ncbi:MAG: hypothetical protein ACUVRR_09530, partial [Candidatus Fervidibacter sp.]|uniref:hypothetical protein n=1 Tax=Candidatus Fervidibacter sp. TaxID=3100871 RepID=UPI004049AE66
VWVMLVQWNIVKLANVGGVVCVLVLMVASERDILEHTHPMAKAMGWLSLMVESKRSRVVGIKKPSVFQTLSATRLEPSNRDA